MRRGLERGAHERQPARGARCTLRRDDQRRSRRRGRGAPPANANGSSRRASCQTGHRRVREQDAGVGGERQSEQAGRHLRRRAGTREPARQLARRRDRPSQSPSRPGSTSRCSSARSASTPAACAGSAPGGPRSVTSSGGLALTPASAISHERRSSVRLPAASAASAWAAAAPATPPANRYHGNLRLPHRRLDDRAPVVGVARLEPCARHHRPLAPAPSRRPAGRSPPPRQRRRGDHRSERARPRGPPSRHIDPRSRVVATGSGGSPYTCWRVQQQEEGAAAAHAVAGVLAVEPRAALAAAAQDLEPAGGQFTQLVEVAELDRLGRARLRARGRPCPP